MSPQPQTFKTSLDAWKFAVVGQKKSDYPFEVSAATQEGFRAFVSEMGKAQISAQRNGIECKLGGSKTASIEIAWITANGHTLRVCYKKGKRAQAVTQTSREAYHAIDFDSQRGKIANCIFDHTVSQGYPDITRKEIEVWGRFPVNAVAGRVNELLEMSAKSPVKFNSFYYQLVTTEPRLSRCEGASSVKNEGLKWRQVDGGGQAKLF